MTKNEFRICFKNIRQDFVLSLNSEEKRAAVERLSTRLIAAQIAAGVIGGYAAMTSELNPISILESLRKQRHDIALPWFENREADMVFKLTEGSLEQGPFGIQQPSQANHTIEPDTILVPLVAADVHGNRIGQGQGHFDRYLAKSRSQRPVIAIGLAWECQIADQLPADPWDQPLDYIATPDRLIEVTS